MLFTRTARGVELTDAGAAYYPYLRDAFDRIAQGTASVGNQTVAGELVLQTYVGVMVKWLVRRLHRFKAAYPAVQLSHLDIASEFEPKRGDIGLIWTADADLPGLHYTYLFNSNLVTLASPSLCRRGELHRPADLAKQTLLYVEGAENDWRAWFQATGLAKFGSRLCPKFDSYLIALEAAIEGQGVAIVPDFMAASDLEAGRLIRVFDIDVKQLGSWYLVCSKNRLHEARIKSFHDWLLLEATADSNNIGSD